MLKRKLSPATINQIYASNSLIPVYNTDGSFNQNGAITKVVNLCLTVQDHTEKITLAVSNLGKTDVFIGHEWLKKHNPYIDWTKS